MVRSSKFCSHTTILRRLPKRHGGHGRQAYQVLLERRYPRLHRPCHTCAVVNHPAEWNVHHSNGRVFERFSIFCDDRAHSRRANSLSVFALHGMDSAHDDFTEVPDWYDACYPPSSSFCIASGRPLKPLPLQIADAFISVPVSL